MGILCRRGCDGGMHLGSTLKSIPFSMETYTSFTNFEPPGNVNPGLAEENAFLSEVKETIQANFANEQFDVTVLARKTYLSVSQLNRRLNALINQPAGQLIWEMKMEYAANLLQSGGDSISRVSFLVGYSNQAHFCRSFKRKYGCTPTRFRDAQA